MDLGWIWDGSGVDLGWIWSGSGVDLGWIWGGSGVDLGWIWVDPVGPVPARSGIRFWADSDPNSRYYGALVSDPAVRAP